jgi:uncharacterized membrane protein YqjE
VERDGQAESGVFSAVRRVGSMIVATLQNRLELLAVEAQEESLHAINTVLLVFAIAALGFFTLLIGVTAVMIVLWNAFGVGALFIASGSGLAGTFIAYWRLRVRLKNWRPFPGTLDELKKDREWLARKN